MSAFTEANRKAFDELASHYNEKEWQRKLSKQIGDALQAHAEWLGVDWSGKNVRLLDFACGTGAVTKVLGPKVNTIRGIDISPNMVSLYNSAARSSGLSETQAKAVVGDLLAETEPENLQGEEYHDFDLAVICAGFHHFEHPSRAVERLTQRLRPGSGVLLIVDFVPFDAEVDREREYRKNHPEADFPDMTHTIKHNGFNEQDMRRMYGDAGLVDFGWDVLPEPAVLDLKKGTVERTIFFAKGRRPA